MNYSFISELIDLGTVYIKKSDRFLEVVGEMYFESGESYSITDLILELCGFQRKLENDWDKYFSQMEDVFNGKMEKDDFLKLAKPIDFDPQETFFKILRITKHIRNKELNLEKLFEKELLFVSDVQWELENIALKLMGINEYPDDWKVLHQFYDGEISVQQVLEEVEKIK